MTWRKAKALLTMRREFDRAFPGRDKTSDGFIGDERHQNESTSDHNPWVKDSRGVGVVRAYDADAGRGTNPNEANDAPGDAFFAAVLKAAKGGHPAMGQGSYIIYEGFIYSRTHGWAKRDYDGDSHQSHVHVSVGRAASSYDSTRAWGIAPASSGTASKTPALANLRYGSFNDDVKVLQERLAKLGFNPGPIDKQYGPQVHSAVQAYQRSLGWSGRDADGLMGPVTLRRLF